MPNYLVIEGGHPLRGQISISGAKNSALPLLTASLLTDQPVHLFNVPKLADIRLMLDILSQHGISVDYKNNQATLTASNITSVVAPYELVKQMRASILVLGPLLAREKRAKVSLPGGCSIGVRPVDLHLMGLQQMGAEIELADGYIYAKAPSGLHGAIITFPIVSVTGTANIMMAATLAKGSTHIIQAAREPEIVDLANLLAKMGANIEGAGTDYITIHGVESLVGAHHTVIPDRLEVATYAIAAAITHGEVDLFPVVDHHITALLSFLSFAGVDIKYNDSILSIKSTDRLNSVDIKTEPFPGFATDVQAPWMALMCLANGASLITETIFENRFTHVPELLRMGANITVQGSTAFVRGVSELKGASVMSTDLRASAALVLAGLSAKGETRLSRIYHLDRGYENLEQKLTNCGAHVERRKIEGEA